MPTRTQISVYELGVRLAQALQLFSSREMREDELDPLRLTALTKLGAAFEGLRSEASIPPSVIEGFNLHFRESHQLWQARNFERQLIEPYTRAMQTHLAGARELLESNFHLRLWGTVRALEWFQLGLQIAAGSGDLTCFHPYPPNWSDEQKSRHPRPSGPVWQWTDREQVHRLHTRLQIAETDLFPAYQETLENAEHHLVLFPERYWGWASIDHGLSKLHALATTPATREIHIRVDMSRQAVIIDGEEVQLESKRECGFVNALVGADGSWISGLEISRMEPELDGRRDRLLRRLPKRVRDLIESQPGKGYRIRRQLTS